MVHLPSIKPIDEELVVRLARETGGLEPLADRQAFLDLVGVPQTMWVCGGSRTC